MRDLTATVRVEAEGLEFEFPRQQWLTEQEFAEALLLRIGLNGYSKLRCDLSPIYRQLVESDPANADRVFKVLISQQVASLTDPFVEQMRVELSDVVFRVQRMKVIALVTETLDLFGKKHTQFYRASGLDEGTARKDRRRGLLIHQFEASRVQLVAEQNPGCSYLGTDDCSSIYRSFPQISHIHFIVDEIKDTERLHGLLCNPIIKYKGKTQRFGNFSVEEAREIIHKLKAGQLSWSILMGMNNEQKADDDLEPESAPSESESEITQFSEEVIVLARELSDLSIVYTRKLRSLRGSLKHVARHSARIDKSAIRHSIDEVVEYFENFYHLFCQLEEICGKMDLMGS